MTHFFSSGELPFLQINKLHSRYVSFVNVVFYLALLAGPFSVTFLDRETGEGAFVAYIYIIFVILSLPILKYYYLEWHPAIVCYFIFLGIGFAVDITTNTVYPIGYLLSLMRQTTVGIVVGLVSYNMVIRDSDNIKRLLEIIAITALTSSIFMFFGLNTRESQEAALAGTRYAVLGQNANATGREMVIGIFFFGMLALRAFSAGALFRRIAFFALPILFISLLKTSSRGSLLTLIITAPFIFMTAINASKKIKYIVWGLIAGLIGFFVLLNSEMMISRLQAAYYERDTGGREYIWDAALATWAKNKWVGGGLITHSEKTARELGAFFYEKKGGRISTHNTYLRALCGGGIVGFCFYLATLILVGKCAWRYRKLPYGNILFVLFVNMLFSGITINIEHAKYLYVLWGVILGFDYHAKKTALAYIKY